MSRSIQDDWDEWDDLDRDYRRRELHAWIDSAGLGPEDLADWCANDEMDWLLTDFTKGDFTHG
jgi:hypothetical protein